MTQLLQPTQRVDREPEEEGRDHPEDLRQRGGQVERQRHAINANSSDLDMLQAEHESLVARVDELGSEQSQFEDAADRLSDLSYGEPPRTSSPAPSRFPHPYSHSSAGSSLRTFEYRAP